MHRPENVKAKNFIWASKYTWSTVSSLGTTIQEGHKSVRESSRKDHKEEEGPREQDV